MPQATLELGYQLQPTYGSGADAILKRSTVAISPRFPRTGSASATPASGTSGAAGTITPERSAVECAAWGATLAVWTYADLASSYGYASTSAFVAELTAAGLAVQATTNTRAVNQTTGPFMQDAGGSNWSAGSYPDRPALNSGQPSPAEARISITIDYMPAADPTGTQAPKLATVAAQIASGCVAVHQDDPRGGMAYAGCLGATAPYDLTSQGCDFSATARAGFTTWLGANTTSAERIAVGLPSSLSSFDILVWLKANKASAMFSPNQTDGTAVDNYLFRTSISNDEALRTIVLGWLGRFLRDDQAAYVQQLRTQLAGTPLSFNFWNAAPSEYLSWHARRGLFDFAVAETAPPYWSPLSAHSVGSSAFMGVRATQAARQHLNAATCDLAGLRACFEHKPTALNTAPARVVVQLLRQSIMQSVMEGHTPVVPIDVFMTINDGEFDQGVDVDGYRFWGARADYKSCFDFIKSNASLLDGYEKLAAVHVAVHNDTFPFHSGNQATRFGTVISRLAELWLADVDYHLLPVGTAAGNLPQPPDRSRELAAPLIIRVQPEEDYYAELGRLSGPRCRRWSSAAVAEAASYAPVRSSNPNVRATARYNATNGRVSVHLHNYALNSDGTPKPQSTTLLWRWGTPAGLATITRLGEASSAVDLSKGHGLVTLREYAIVNFAV